MIFRVLMVETRLWWCRLWKIFLGFNEDRNMFYDGDCEGFFEFWWRSSMMEISKGFLGFWWRSIDDDYDNEDQKGILCLDEESNEVLIGYLGFTFGYSLLRIC